MEQIDYNLLLRWFVELARDAPVWHPSVFTHNRDRLLEAEHGFLPGLPGLRPVKRLLSSDRFSVDDADRGLGGHEALPAQGRLGRPARSGPQRRARLSQGKALLPDACLDHRSGCAALHNTLKAKNFQTQIQTPTSSEAC